LDVVGELVVVVGSPCASAIVFVTVVNGALVVVDCACFSTGVVSDMSCVVFVFAVDALAVISEDVFDAKLEKSSVSAAAVDEVIEESSPCDVDVVVETVVVSSLATVVCAGKLADVVAAVEDVDFVVVVSIAEALADNPVEVDCPRFVEVFDSLDVVGELVVAGWLCCVAPVFVSVDVGEFVVVDCVCTTSPVVVLNVSCAVVVLAVDALAVVSEGVEGEKPVDAGVSAKAVVEVIVEDSLLEVGVVVETVDVG
jgi:hypothetical protein